MSTPAPADRLVGCLLGTAVGDAVGLPLEGMTPARARKIFGIVESDFGMRLFLRRGFLSDDTEHALLTLQAFVASGGSTAKFESELARRLKFWFLKLPPGTGLATAKACCQLLIGISPQRSGVLSAGNGPAMRAPVLGVMCGDEAELRRFIRTSSRITHVDTKAEIGAYIIALATRFSMREEHIDATAFLKYLTSSLLQVDDGNDKDELFHSVQSAVKSVLSSESTPAFALSLGMTRGASGYILHTVPVVIHAWLRNPENLREAVLECLRCGGDTDSTGAIAGGIVGARVGEKGVPANWLQDVCEWPHGVKWIRENAQHACTHSLRPVGFTDLFVLPRNILLLSIVLWHGFRRMLPPY